MHFHNLFLILPPSCAILQLYNEFKLTNGTLIYANGQKYEMASDFCHGAGHALNIKVKNIREITFSP